MKVCIYGAGAIGGFIGARLGALPECEVSAVARGATRDALAEPRLALARRRHDPSVTDRTRQR